MVSKWDKLFNDTSFNYEEQLIIPFANKFSAKVSSFKIFPIAARPKTSVVEYGYGLYELLNDCYLARKNVILEKPQSVMKDSGREFYQIKTRAKL